MGSAFRRGIGYVTEQLREQGVFSQCLIGAQDWWEPNHIRRVFEEVWEGVDVVISFGDLWQPAGNMILSEISQALGVSLVQSEGTLVGKGVPMQIFEGAEYLGKDVAGGRWPGIWYEKDGKYLIILPEKEKVLRHIFHHEVLPRLRERGLLGPDTYLQLRATGITEEEMASRLKPVLSPFGERVVVGFREIDGIVDARIYLKAAGDSVQDIEDLKYKCEEALGEDFLCFGNSSLSAVIGRMLRRKEEILAIADGATSGAMMKNFWGIPGFSRFFGGGVVCSSPDAIELMLDMPKDMIVQHGMLSNEVVVGMAIGVGERLGADYGLSVIGMNAGNIEESVEIEEGFVLMGLSSPRGVWVKKLYLPISSWSGGDRIMNAALDWLRREIILNEQ